MSSGKQAKVDVIINNEQARARLAEITKDLNEVKKMRDKAFETGDVKGFNQLNTEYKKLTTESGKFAKQTVDVNAVMKDLSGASIREINAAYQQMNKELKDMKRNDPGFAEKQAQVKALKDEMNSSTGPVTGFNAAWSSAKGVMALAAGVMAGLSGAIGFGKSVIESTGATAREFNAITTGLTWAWDEFKKAIATSDFTSLISNMGDAISAGREYVNLLADVKKSTRALSITNSELNIEFQKLKVVERDVSKPLEERIAAGKKALDIEMQMTKDSQEVAKKAMDAELLHLRTITKLKDEDIKAAVATYNSNKKNLDLANEYNKALETTSAKNAQGTSQTRKTPEGEAAYQRTITLVDKASPEIKKLAGVMKAMGKTTGEELDAMAEKWVTYNNVEVESIQKTARVKITLGRLNKGYLDDTNRDEKAAAKEHEKIVKEAQKTLSQLIAEKDAEIQAAIESGNIPLAEKSQIEKKAMEELAETYKRVKDAIAKGWNLNQHDSGTIKKLVSIGAPSGEADSPSLATPNVKSDIPVPERLKKRDNKISSGPSADIVAYETKAANIREQIKDAAINTAVDLNNTIFNLTKNRQQAEFDHKMNLLEKQKQGELSNAKLTDEQKIAIQEKFAKKEAALKIAYFKKEQNASAIQALINGALGITKTFAAYGFTPPGWVAAAALAAATLVEVAAIKSAKPPEYYEGGFTDQDINDKKPVGVVHANEFVASAEAVKNPNLRKIFDVVDYAQRTGSVSRLNITDVIHLKNSQGFDGGGYTNDRGFLLNRTGSGPAFIDPISIKMMIESQAKSGLSVGAKGGEKIGAKNIEESIKEREIKAMIRHTAAMEKMVKEGLYTKFSLYDLEKIQKDKRNLESSVDM